MNFKQIVNKRTLYIILGSIAVVGTTFHILNAFKTSPLEENIQQLKIENNKLIAENKHLLEVQEEYKQSVDKLQNENIALTEENDEILKNVSDLEQNYDASNKTIAQLKEQNDKKSNTISYLKQELSKYSDNNVKHKQLNSQKHTVVKKMAGIEKYRKRHEDKCRDAYYPFVFQLNNKKEEQKYKNCLRKVANDVKKLKEELRLAK